MGLLHYQGLIAGLYGSNASPVGCRVGVEVVVGIERKSRRGRGQCHPALSADHGRELLTAPNANIALVRGSGPRR